MINAIEKNNVSDNNKKHILTDIHSHVIPHLDDGSTSLDMSLEMLKMAYEQGVKNVFCTTHNWGQLDRYANKFIQLNDSIKENGIMINLYKGCEINCSLYDVKGVVNVLKSNRMETLNDTKYILIEFSPHEKYFKIITVIQYIMSNSDFKIVIAHPERYKTIYNSIDFAEELVELGCCLQINAYSLVEEQDELIKNAARTLLKKKLVTFIGSDAHSTNHRPPNVKSGIEYIYQKCDKEYADAVCFKNAETLLNVIPVDNCSDDDTKALGIVCYLKGQMPCSDDSVLHLDLDTICEYLPILDEFTSFTLKILNLMANKEYYHRLIEKYKINDNVIIAYVINCNDLDNSVRQILQRKKLSLNDEQLNTLSIFAKIIILNVFNKKISKYNDQELISFIKRNKWKYMLSSTEENSKLFNVVMLSKINEFCVKMSFQVLSDGLSQKINNLSIIFTIGSKKRTVTLKKISILDKCIRSVCSNSKSFRYAFDDLVKFSKNNSEYIISIILNNNLKWENENNKLIAEYGEIIFTYNKDNNLFTVEIADSVKHNIIDSNGEILDIILFVSSSSNIKVRKINNISEHICKIKNNRFTSYKKTILDDDMFQKSSYRICKLYFCNSCRKSFITTDEFNKIKNKKNCGLKFVNVSLDNIAPKPIITSSQQTSESPTVITVADLVVRAVSSRCIKNHPLQSVKATIPLMTDTGIVERMVHVTYCPQCKQFYMGEAVYLSLKADGVICCKVIEYEVYKNNSSDWAGWQKKSIMNLYGYNVNKASGLSPIKRQRILMFLIENNIMRKHDIISHIESQIALKKKMPSMKDAIAKWKCDIDFLHHYHSSDMTVKVRTIFAKKY